MSTTVQQILDAAMLQNTANSRVLGQREVLERVNFAEQDLFTKLAQENRYLWATSGAFPSTNGAQGRSIDLAVPGQNAIVERVLRLELPTGVEVNLVDIQDRDAELAPRAYPLGTKLFEIGSEWQGSIGSVAITVFYAYRPAELSLTGALTQAVALYDRFVSYYHYDLAWYMAHSDAGRAIADPGEIQRLSALREGVYQTILQHADHFAGPAWRRFHLPVPSSEEKA